MTDKEIFEKLEAEIERLENYKNESVTSSDTRFGWIHGKTFALTSIRVLLDSMQKDPKECMYSKDNYTDEDRKSLCDGCEEECIFNKKEYSVNNGLDLGCGVIWRDEEPVSEDWEEAAFDYAEACKYDGGEKLLCVEHFKAGANWKNEQMMAKAVKVNISNASIVSLPVNCDLKAGDKVLIIKKD